MRVAASPSITLRRCYGTHWARQPPAAEVLVHAIAERCPKKKSMYLLFGTFLFLYVNKMWSFSLIRSAGARWKKALYSGTKKINELNMQSQPTQPPHLHVISVLCVPPIRPVGISVCFVPGLVNLLFGCTYHKYYYIFLNRFEYINSQNMKRKEKKFYQGSSQGALVAFDTNERPRVFYTQPK